MTHERAEPRAKAGWAAAIGLSLLGVAAIVLALAGLEIDPTVSREAGRANLAALRPFWVASAIGWLGLTALLVLLLRNRRAPRGPGLLAAGLIVAVAFAARASVVLVHEPALSDDLWRYVVDGRAVAEGVNPYLHRPEDSVARTGDAADAMDRALVARLNNPELHTIYLPTSQIVFGGIAVGAREITGETARSPRAWSRWYRFTFVGFDLAAIVVLLAVLAAAGRSPWWAALYAWHPLTITEVAGSGHQDVIGIALLLVALALFSKWPGRMWTWTTALALGGLAKPLAILPAAFMLRNKSWKSWVASAALGAVVCIALSLPFWAGGDALRNLWTTSSRFVLKWAHFGSIYEPLLGGIEMITPEWTNDPQEQLARALCALGAILVAGWIWWRTDTRTADRSAIWRALMLVFFAFVLLSPAAHPWYLLWALVLLPMAPSPSVWVASLTVPWGYAAWGYVLRDGTLSWGVGAVPMVLAYVPVYAAVLAELFTSHRRWAECADPER